MPFDKINEIPKSPPKVVGLRERYSTKRLKSEIKLVKIMRLLDKGYSPTEAVEAIGIRRIKASVYMNRIRKRLKKEQSELADSLRYSAERKLNYVYRQYINEFDISKKNSKGERVPGRIEYLDGARNLIQDITKLHGLNVELPPAQTNIGFSWGSLTQPNPLANPQPPALHIEATNVDPIEEKIRQLENKTQIPEASVTPNTVHVSEDDDTNSAHIPISNPLNGSPPKTSDTLGKKRIIVMNASNGKNGHTSNGKQYHPEE